MSEKIAFLRRDKVGAVPLLHQIAERDGLEAVVVCVRIDGEWHTAWGGDLNAGSLALAAMKVFRDVSNATEKNDDTGGLGRE